MEDGLRAGTLRQVAIPWWGHSCRGYAKESALTKGQQQSVEQGAGKQVYLQAPIASTGQLADPFTCAPAAPAPCLHPQAFFQPCPLPEPSGMHCLGPLACFGCRPSIKQHRLIPVTTVGGFCCADPPFRGITLTSYGPCASAMHMAAGAA